MRRLTLPFALSLALAAGCGSPQHSTPLWQTIPVARCGMKPYHLLDPATLGQVVHSDEIPELQLTADAVRSLIAQDTSYPGASELIEYGTRVFRFRYTTQDRGQKVEATALLGVPYGPEVPTTPLPVTVFLHGTTGFSDPCAPSRDLGQSAGAALLASLGFVAVLPDYIGMNGEGAPSTVKHGYLVGEQVALGSWDAVRAGLELLKQLELGTTASDQVVIWGGSQGGHAAMFTELYGPYYAPEFQVPGVVALVAPTVLKPLAQAAVSQWGPPTESFAAVMDTWHDWYGAPANLDDVLTDDAPYHFASTIEAQIYPEDTCDTAQAYSAIGDHPDEQKPSTVYLQSFIDKVQAGDDLAPWSCYLDENSLRFSSVKPKRFTPTYMVYSQKDDLVITAPMRSEFTNLCSMGYKLHYLECEGAGHSEGASWSLPEQLQWVRDRLAGKPLTGMCQVTAPVCCSMSPQSVCTP